MIAAVAAARAGGSHAELRELALGQGRAGRLVGAGRGLRVVDGVVEAQRPGGRRQRRRRRPAASRSSAVSSAAATWVTVW